MMAIYTFEGGIRAFFESTPTALETADFPDCNPRCSIDIFATQGRIWSRENGSWGYQLEGMALPFIEKTRFDQDDIQAQSAYTQAIATWLDDASTPHRCRFEIAQLGFDLVMAAYRSALKGRRIKWPPLLTEEEWAQLRDGLIL